MKRKIPYVLISAQCNRKWYDFTLQKNHLFGEDFRGKFVVNGMDDKYIYLYRGYYNIDKTDPHFNSRPSLYGTYIWHKERIPRTCLTARLILQKHEETGKKPVEFKSTEKLVKELYNPRNTVWDSGFQRMRHTYIPGGGYTKVDNYDSGKNGTFKQEGRT